MKSFVGTASKNFGGYFSLDLYAQVFSRKILPIATQFNLNPPSDEVNIRRCVLTSQPWFVQGRGLQCLDVAEV